MARRKQKMSAQSMDWLYGEKKPSATRDSQVAKRVSDAIKMQHPYRRAEFGRKFAEKMRAAAARVRRDGCRKPGVAASPLNRALLNALCWGAGDGHNRTMIARYEAAAKAAERFCHR